MSRNPPSLEKEKPPVLSGCTPTIALLALLLSGISLVCNVAIGTLTYFNTQKQTKIAESQAAIAKQQADLKNWQSRFDLEHHRLTIDPVTYRLEIPVDAEGVVLNQPTLEMVNSSQRAATGLAIEWELVGTDFGSGSLDGWDTLLPVNDPPRTLLAGERLIIDQFPVPQLSVVGKPIKKNPQATIYIGHLNLTYRDSAESTKFRKSIRFHVYKDKAKSILVLQLIDPPPEADVVKDER